jgi:hypothetical protein
VTRYAVALLLATIFAPIAQAADPYTAYSWLPPGQFEAAFLARAIILNELNQQRRRNGEQRQPSDLGEQPRFRSDTPGQPMELEPYGAPGAQGRR